MLGSKPMLAVGLLHDPPVFFVNIHVIGLSPAPDFRWNVLKQAF